MLLGPRTTGPYSIYTLMVVVGISVRRRGGPAVPSGAHTHTAPQASVQWGTFTQFFAIFPQSVQTVFFLGSMCPFMFYGPLNAGLGELCTAKGGGTLGIATPWGGSTAVGDPGAEYDTHWARVVPFFALACVLTVMGCAAAPAHAAPLPTPTPPQGLWCSRLCCGRSPCGCWWPNAT